MNDHEQRWRDAMSSDLAAYDDDDGINNVRCGDIRGMLADLATARAALVSVQRESDQESARAGKCADDLATARAERDKARREALEEAARLIMPPNPPSDWTMYAEVCATCANRIRALIEEPK